MSLDIIIGPMFSGKSSRILDIASRYAAIGTKVLIIKHASDRRYEYSENNVVTHDGRKTTCVEALDIHHPKLMSRVKDHNVIIVEEAQFFTHLVPFVEYVVDTLEKRLYFVGLDGDSNRRPFGEILQCIPLADRVEKIAAFCRRCANGTPGIFTTRTSGPQDQQVIVGGNDTYETHCRECYLRQFQEDPRLGCPGK